MSYPPQQPGNWSDPSWSAQQPVGAGDYQPTAYPSYGYPLVASPPTTNGLAIAALVCSIAGVASCITAPVGAILGHVARRQIRERGEGGDGMALAGIIIGWILTAVMLLVIAFYVVVFIMALTHAGAFNSN